MLTQTRSRLALIFLAILMAGCGSEEPSVAAPVRAVPEITEAPVGMSALVPNDAVFFGMIPSIEEFERVLNIVASSVEKDLNDPTPIRTMLKELDAFDVSLIDHTSPMGFAIGMAAGDVDGFTPVLLLPASDAAALLGSVKSAEGIAAPILQGDYVGIPQGPTYATADTAHPLTSNMEASVVHLRFDMQALLKTMGPMIDAQFSSMRELFDSTQDEDMGIDIGPFMGLYLDALSSGFYSMEGLDLEVSLAGSTLEISGDLHLIPGSTLSAFHSEQPMDLNSVLACLDMEAAVTTLMGIDGEQYYQQIQPLMDALIGAYPEEVRTALSPLIGSYDAIYPFLNGPIATSFDFSNDGMRLASYAESTKPEGLLQAIRGVLTTFEEVGMEINGPVETSIGGVAVQQFNGSIDAARFPAEMSTAMSTVYGEKTVMTLALNGERVFVGAGNSAPFLEASIERLDQEGSGAAHEFEYLAERFKGANPVMLTQLDIAKLMALAYRLTGMPQDPVVNSSPLRVTLFAAMLKEEMSAGMRIDLDMVKSSVQGVKARRQAASSARNQIEASLKSVQEGADPVLVAGELDRLINDLTGALGDPGGKVPNMTAIREAVHTLKQEHATDSQVMKALGPALERLLERTKGKEAPAATGLFEYDL